MSQALTIHNVGAELDAEIGSQIATLLPPDVSPDRFKAVALAAIRQKPDLLTKCDRPSIFSALVAAAQDGLLPDGREGAIVPRKGKAVWQPMVAGIYKRVKSSGSVASLSANVVYDGEQFDVLLGDEDRIVHRRDMALVQDGHEVAVYAIAILKDGSREREVMTREQVEQVRKSSSAPDAEPWAKWYGEMARKTVVRRLAKRLPVLDPADEALHRTIERVDQLYDFGTPRVEAPPPAPPATGLRAVAAAVTQQRKVAPKVEVYDTPKQPSTPPLTRADYAAAWEKMRRTYSVLAALNISLRNAKSADEVDWIVCCEEVMTAKTTYTGDDKTKIDKHISDALAKWWTTPPDATETPEDLEIPGEEKMAAG